MKKVLVMGLPGSGKTFLSEKLVSYLHNKGLKTSWFNADSVRATYDDWDFSEKGRERQAKRMSLLCSYSEADVCVCDFVCPNEKTMRLFDPDFVIWMNTIQSGRFEDTNKIFEQPKNYDIKIDSLLNQKTLEEDIFDSVLAFVLHKG